MKLTPYDVFFSNRIVKFGAVSRLPIIPKVLAGNWAVGIFAKGKATQK